MTGFWDGWPAKPEVSGWHWVEDASGLRPLLWRGEDWPEAVDRLEWQDGVVICAPADLRGDHYFGPVAMPSIVAERFLATCTPSPRLQRPGTWTGRPGMP